MSIRRIDVNAIARLEGEAALRVHIEDGQVRQVQLNIFEPPRLFEALLRGRDFGEVPDITARICGICPVAYMMSSTHALEAACGVRVDGELRALRRLLYCGEWIESHVLHMVMLHLPDFLGVDDGITIAQQQPALVENALRLKALGNRILQLVGGREVHPVNVCVGGFYKLPDQAQLLALRDELRWGLGAAEDLLGQAAALDFPQATSDWELLALSHPDEYPFNEGLLRSSAGLEFPAAEFDSRIQEYQVPHSTALQAGRREAGDHAPLCLGPLARLALNLERLPPRASAAARSLGFPAHCHNPFRSILARGVELIFACEEALSIIERYAPPDAPRLEVEPRAGSGQAATEAPRGICYHSYTLAADGRIEHASIVPPTAVNQIAIERDLFDCVSANLDLSDDDLRQACERRIRNYDPCISCAAHFLRLEVDRN